MNLRQTHADDCAVKPVRIQRKRTPGWKMPPNTVSVTRPGPFGNPWSVSECAAEFDETQNAARHHVIRWFREWIALPNDHEMLDDGGAFGGTREQHAELHRRLPELRGKNLACFCKIGVPCHAYVLLEIANAEPPK